MSLNNIDLKETHMVGLGVAVILGALYAVGSSEHKAFIGAICIAYISIITVLLVVLNIYRNALLERKRREDTYDENLFGLNATGIVRCSIDSQKVVMANKYFCAMLGYTSNELIGRPIYEFTADEDREQNRAAILLLLRGKLSRVRLEKRYIHKNGSIVWGSIEVAVEKPIHKGKITSTIAFVKDITEEKRAAAVIRASEEKFRQLSDATPNMVWTADTFGKVDFVNKYFINYTGLPQWPPTPEGLRGPIHPEDLPKVQQNWFQAMVDQTSFSCEARLRNHEGHYRWFMCRGYPMRDEKGEIYQWIGTGTDIENLMQQEISLKKEVKARDDFMSIASHELKTPLTSLKLQLQIARRQAAITPDNSLPPERLSRLFQISIKQTDRLTKLVEDLIDVSRIQSGQFTYNFSSHNLNEILTQVLDRYTEVAKSTETPIQLNLPHNPVILDCDANRMEQVITNLLANALKYAPGKPINVGLFEEDGRYCISVKDSGPGIPKEKHVTIFEQFERAHTSSSVSGLGLGLFIVREICTAHGGSISVNSHPNEGAEFIVRLPHAKSMAIPVAN